MVEYSLGIVGGSGLYEMEGLEAVREFSVDTPYGAPSDRLVEGRLPMAQGGSRRLVFLPRHGRGHRFSPSEINYRANICALKKAGVTHVLSVSAVGSLREEIAPGDLVVVDQFIDLTRKRVGSFFEEGIVAHVALADPVCHELANAVVAAASDSISASGSGGSSGRSPRVHGEGTYVCMEGPQFSTRAESRVYRTWGASVIGMTAMPEAKLAREAALPYATLALATDYDCWHETEEDVSVEAVLQVMANNVTLARRVIRTLASNLPDPTRSRAYGASTNAVITGADHVPGPTREKLSWLLGR